MKKLIISFIALAFFLNSCTDGSGGVSATDGTLTGQGGSLARFVVVKDYLYIVDGQNLKLFNLNDPSNPVYLSNSDLNVNVETIFARDSATLFIGTTSGMFIYDISNPPNVNLISSYSHIVSCDPVVANSKYAYVTLHSDLNNQFCARNINQLDIVNIEQLSQPFIVNSFPLIKPLGLGLYGDTLLICDNGVKVFNVKDPNNLQLINAIEDIPAVDIIPSGDLMIISSTEGIKQYRYKNGSLNLLSEI